MSLRTDIVLCKECRWFRICETEDFETYLDCDHPDGGGIPRSEEWYCADGEKEKPIVLRNICKYLNALNIWDCFIKIEKVAIIK